VVHKINPARANLEGLIYHFSGFYSILQLTRSDGICLVLLNKRDSSAPCDRSQVATCSGILRTVDELIVGQIILDEVRKKKRNLAVAFYNYRKAYDIVRHDWMLRVYRLIGVPEKM
jgi:hypothetical protein